jgi:hypothetical protein
MNHPVVLQGRVLEIPYPPTIESLRDRGAAFLAKAFRAADILDIDNAVIVITEDREFFGDDMGRKFLLTVAYERPIAALQTQALCQVPPRFRRSLARMVRAPLMEPEVRFALLWRCDDFPIIVPRCFFADFATETMSGILITERIAYWEDGLNFAFVDF